MVMSCMETSILKFTEDEITGKRKKGQPKKSWEKCVKKDLGQYDLKRENVGHYLSLLLGLYRKVKKLQLLFTPSL